MSASSIFEIVLKQARTHHEFHVRNGAVHVGTAQDMPAECRSLMQTYDKAMPRLYKALLGQSASDTDFSRMCKLILAIARRDIECVRFTNKDGKKLASRTPRKRQRSGSQIQCSCSWVSTFMFGAASKTHTPMQLLLQALAEPKRSKINSDAILAICEILFVLDESDPTIIGKFIGHISEVISTEVRTTTTLGATGASDRPRHLNCFGGTFTTNSILKDADGNAGNRAACIRITLNSKDCVDAFLVCLTRLVHILLPRKFHQLTSTQSCISLWKALLLQLNSNDVSAKLRSVTMESMFTLLKLAGPSSDNLRMLGVPRSLSSCLRLRGPEGPAERGKRFDDVLAHAIRLVCREFHDGSGHAEGESIVDSQLVTCQSTQNANTTGYGFDTIMQNQPSASILDSPFWGSLSQRIVSFIVPSGVFNQAFLIRNLQESKSPELCLELCVCYLLAGRLRPEIFSLDITVSLLQANTVSFCIAMLLDSRRDNLYILHEIANCWHMISGEGSLGKRARKGKRNKNEKRRSSGRQSINGSRKRTNDDAKLLEVSPGHNRGISKRFKNSASMPVRFSPTNQPLHGYSGNSRQLDYNDHMYQSPQIGLAYGLTSTTPFATTPLINRTSSPEISEKLYGYVEEMAEIMSRSDKVKPNHLSIAQSKNIEKAIAFALLLLKTDNFFAQSDLLSCHYEENNLDDDLQKKHKLTANILAKSLPLLKQGCEITSVSQDSKLSTQTCLAGIESEAVNVTESRVIPFHTQVMCIALGTCPDEAVGKNPSDERCKSWLQLSRAVFEACLRHKSIHKRAAAAKLLPTFLDKIRKNSVLKEYFVEMATTFSKDLCEILRDGLLPVGKVASPDLNQNIIVSVANAVSALLALPGTNIFSKSFCCFEPVCQFLSLEHARIDDHASAVALVTAVANIIRSLPPKELKTQPCMSLARKFISLLRSPSQSIREAAARQADIFAVEGCRVVTCAFSVSSNKDSLSSKRISNECDALAQFTDLLDSMMTGDEDYNDKNNFEQSASSHCKTDDSLRAILTALGTIGCALSIPTSGRPFHTSRVLPHAVKSAMSDNEADTTVMFGKKENQHNKKQSDIDSNLEVSIRQDTPSSMKNITQSNEWLLLDWVIGLFVETWADQSLPHAVRSTSCLQCVKVARSKGFSTGDLLLFMGLSDPAVIINNVRTLLTHPDMKPSEAMVEFHKYFCVSLARSDGANKSGHQAQISNSNFFEKTIEHALPYLICNQEDALLAKYASALHEIRLQREVALRERGQIDLAAVNQSDTSQPYATQGEASQAVQTLVHNNLPFIIPHILMLRDNEQRLLAIKFMLTCLSSKNPVFDDIINKYFLKVLKQLCWLNGGNRESVAGSHGDVVGGLRRLACIYIPKRFPGETDVKEGKGEVSTNLMISHYFLHVIGYLQNRIAIARRERNSNTKRRGIICMHKLLCLVSETYKNALPFLGSSRNISKKMSKKSKLSHYYKGEDHGESKSEVENSIDDPFVPFISTILVNLSSATADEETRDLAVYMWHDFVHMLKPTTLSRCMYPMVVSLFQVLRRNGLASNLADVSSVEKVAVDTLRYVIVDQCDILQGELCTLPLHAKEMQTVGNLVPDVLRVVESAISEVTSEELIKKLISCVVDSQSSNLAINVAVLRELKYNLEKYLKDSHLSDEMIGEGSARSLVVTTVAMLLKVARNATDLDTKLLCAECLGQLGALDPSRILSGADELSSYPIKSLALERPPPVKSSESLAVHLIGTFLVKSFRAAGDPKLQNCCAASIQHGLRFVHEAISASSSRKNSKRKGKRSQSSSTSAPQKGELPYRVASQFSPTVIEVIRPFWSTNLQLPVRQKIEKPPFFSSHSLFEMWVCSWAKYMMQQAMGPHMHVFRITLPSIRPVSAGSVTDAHQIARYLLPYLIRDMLCYAKSDEERNQRQKQVLNELLLVLMGPQSNGHASDNAKIKAKAKSVHTVSRPQTSYQLICVQAVFSLLDELNEWIARTAVSEDSGSKDSAAKTNKSGRAKKSSRPSKNKATGHGEGGLLTEAEEAEICQKVLAQISHRVLADAAFRVKAYARAAMYLERDMRARYDPSSQGVARGSNCYGKERVYKIPFSQEEVEYLRRIFAHIDEPDTMQGLMHLRGLVQKQGADAYPGIELGKRSKSRHIGNKRDTYGNRDLRELREAIIDHEHASEWDEALTCYEQLLDLFLHEFGGGSDDLEDKVGEEDIEMQDESSNLMPPPEARSPQSAKSQMSCTHQTALSRDNRLQNIYLGIMRNLANSGHHETLLHHAIGAMQHSDISLSETVIPFAMEASWRLGRWDLLEDLTEKEANLQQFSFGGAVPAGGVIEETQRSFMVNVSEALLSLRIDNALRLQNSISTARAAVMGALSAASMESYEQAYPLILKLHVLHEIEESQTMMQLGSAEEKRAFRKERRWDQRLHATRPSVRDHEALLAVRRAIYRIEGEIGTTNSTTRLDDNSVPSSKHFNTFHSEEARGWIHLAQLCTAAGDQKMASSAVTHAMLLDDVSALVEKAKFYRAKNDLHRALILLDAGMPSISNENGLSSSSLSAEHIEEESPKKSIAQRILLAADWTFESGLSAGDDVINRYRRAMALCPKWEAGYFSLGRYYDRLLKGQEDLLDKEDRDIFTIKSIPRNASSEQVKDAIASAERDSHTASLVFDHAVKVVQNYGLSMRYGHRNVHVTLPRLLTVWFDYSNKLNEMVEQEKHADARRFANRVQRHCDPKSYLSRLNQLLKVLSEDIPAYQWFMALPQLVSHMGLQENGKCSQILNGIISKVIRTYPRHIVWTVMGVANMRSTVVGKKRSDAFVKVFRHVVTTEPDPAGIVLQTASKLFYDLISLAKLNTGKNKYVTKPLGNRKELENAKLLVPKQSQLMARLPGPDEQAVRDDDWNAFGGGDNGLVTIVKFEENVRVITSAVCPKKLVCCGSNGRKYNLLCKFEKKGDFRKDSRMMKLFTLINRFLQGDPEGRRRNLRMRTYNVTCLDEKSGLLEWVDNTMPIQFVIDGVYGKHPGTVPAKLTTRVFDKMNQLAHAYPTDPEAIIQSYRHQIVSKYPTLFHEWFDSNFSVPAEWFEARLSFSRSVAVWSMVGHIVGLGDRHSQNILLDLGTGECVHVDFDCIFDKGLLLRTPERAPFRLTRNIVDGMGVTGYEGVFRHCCECTMGILRSQQNQDMLINNLEAFVHDPLVTWFKTGSGSRSSGTAHTSREHASSQDNRIDPLLSATHSATHVLSTIRLRLSGVYNYSIENVLLRNPEKKAHMQRKLASSMREAGVREAQAVIDNIPLSVQGQVQRLIKEATSEDNLIQMYPGWMPFL